MSDRPMHFGDPRLPQRFWDKVVPEPNTGCWLWTAKTRQGYGQFRFAGAVRSSHRVLWAALHGELGPLDVPHRCDTPPCCNPDHLFLGDDAANMADKMRKGRHVARRGEANGNSRLSDADVIEIRRRYVPRRVSMRRLGREFGVDPRVIHYIVHRKQWRHLSEGVER